MSSGSAEIAAAISRALPPQYDFQITQIIARATQLSARHIGLQFPDGLLMYAGAITSIVRHFVPKCPAVTVLADVVYGACCIDDLTAAALGVDFLVHFGHSCLVPVDQTVVKTMYVLVRIHWDIDHLIETVKHNFPLGSASFSLQGTVQFSQRLPEVVLALQALGYEANVPHCKPLGPGETLGCTAPVIQQRGRVILFVADGRFHLEAAMMANPTLTAYRYDPYAKRIYHEQFDHDLQKAVRIEAMRTAAAAKRVGLIFGTLGRQGSVGILESVKSLLEQRKIETFILLISEIDSEKLKLYPSIDAWVQVACPRLSIDWGEAYNKPLLSSWEAFQVWGVADSRESDSASTFPMDYYANSGGEWTNYGVQRGYGGSQAAKFTHILQFEETTL